MEQEIFYQIVLYIISGIYGLCVGSFLNVVIYRTPLNMSVAKPASHCPNCNNPIKWYDNIPVLSYILLKGKCRNCKEPISVRYTLVEIANALFWLLSVFVFMQKGLIYILISAICSSVLVCIFFIDLEHKIILDRFQIILLSLALIITAFDTVKDFKSLYSHLFGGLFGFLTTYIIGYLVSKKVGREALGGGDIKLCGVMGLLLGFPKFLLGIILASLTACVLVLISNIKAKNKNTESEFPFAPFLTVGFLVALFFGEKIISLYLSLFI